jgi:hypothetical protein
MRDVIPAGVPGIVKATVIGTFFNTWVLFDETLVDRYGLWEYMPTTASPRCVPGTSARSLSSPGSHSGCCGGPGTRRW